MATLTPITGIAVSATPAVDAVKQTLTDSLTTIIADAEVKSADLRAQLATLQTQMKTIKDQITAAEGPDAQKAREDLQALAQFMQRRR